MEHEKVVEAWTLCGVCETRDRNIPTTRGGAKVTETKVTKTGTSATVSSVINSKKNGTPIYSSYHPRIISIEIKLEHSIVGYT